MAESYPLDWPPHWARTPSHRRRRSKFGKHTFAANRDECLRELRLLNARAVVLSTNLPLRLDGVPYATGGKGAANEDPGVAAHFSWRARPFVIACDTFKRVEDNVRAVGKTIEAMRAIERYGASELLERAVSGFSALPPGAESGPPERDWWDVLGIPKWEGIEWAELASGHPMAGPMLKMCELLYKQKAHDEHPDRGGSNEKMAELNLAIERARKALVE